MLQTSNPPNTSPTDKPSPERPDPTLGEGSVGGQGANADPENSSNLPIDKPPAEKPDSTLGEGAVGGQGAKPDHGNSPNLPKDKPQPRKPDSTLGDGAVGGQDAKADPENPPKASPIDKSPPEKPENTLGEGAVGGQAHDIAHGNPPKVSPITKPPPGLEVGNPPQTPGAVLDDPFASSLEDSMLLDDTLGGRQVDRLLNLATGGRQKAKHYLVCRHVTGSHLSYI